MTKPKELLKNICYISATEHPLSADVGVIHGNSAVYFYDVGSSDDVFDFIEKIHEPKVFILSHFHPDHILNIKRLSVSKIYTSAYTIRHLPKNIASLSIPVNKRITIEDGIKLELFPLPSSHSKGCVAATINESFTFVGDGIYSQSKNGCECYNKNLMQDMILTIRSSAAKKLLISHSTNFVKDRDMVIDFLENLCRLATQSQGYLYIKKEREPQLQT